MMELQFEAEGGCRACLALMLRKAADAVAAGNQEGFHEDDMIGAGYNFTVTDNGTGHCIPTVPAPSV